MGKYASKKQENKNRSVVNATSQKQSGHDPAAGFSDQRPETTASKGLQTAANNNPKTQQLKAFQDMANNSPQARKAAQLQAMADHHSAHQQAPVQKKENKTGLPDHLKTGTEALSGYSMDDVKVHYNSSQPAQLNAHAYAQGTDIHVAPGQEKHLAHEAWHVVQQKQGRVKPTLQMKGKVNVNDDAGLEKEADVMGAKALSLKNDKTSDIQKHSHVQRMQVTQLMIAADQGKFAKFLKSPINVAGFKESVKPYANWLKVTSYKDALTALSAFIASSGKGDNGPVQAELKKIAGDEATEERYTKGKAELGAAAAASAAVAKPSGVGAMDAKASAAGARMEAEDHPAQLPVLQGTFMVTSDAMHAGLKTWGAVVCSVVGMQVRGTSICALAHFDSSSDPAAAIPLMLQEVRKAVVPAAIPVGAAAAAAMPPIPMIDVFVASTGREVPATAAASPAAPAAAAAGHHMGLDANQLFSQIIHVLRGDPDVAIHDMGQHPVDVDAGIDAEGFFIIKNLVHNNLTNLREMKRGVIHAAVIAHRHLQVLPTHDNDTGREGARDAQGQIAMLGGLKPVAPPVLKPMSAASPATVLYENYDVLIAKQLEMISQQLLLIHNTHTSRGDVADQMALLQQMEVLLEEMKSAQKDTKPAGHH